MLTKVRILCNRDGQILAAHPIDLRASGEDGPSGLNMVADKDQTIEIIEIPEDLTKISPPELFRTHVVQGGRLVPKGRAGK